MNIPTAELRELSTALETLWATIESRKGASPEASYTASLLHKGVAACAKKVGEEAVEVALAAVSQRQEDTEAEIADLLYHLLVLMVAADVDASQVAAKLEARPGQSGLAEKAS
ncbi:MAG: phosphoribosyl-ATP diphosphatase, partial [Pseudomonadota bacterium]